MRRPHAAQGEAGSAQYHGANESGQPDEEENDKQLFRGGGSVRRLVVFAGGASLFGLCIVWFLGGGLSPATAVVEQRQTAKPVAITTAIAGPESTSRADLPVSVAPKPVASTGAPEEDEEASMNAILDDLLNLHRTDVKNREDTIVDAEDLPVSYSQDSLVVSMADGGYAACVIRLMDSVRGAGRWGGPLVVLVPTGPGTLPLASSAEERLKALGATLIEVAPEAAGGTRIRGAGSATQYGKVVLLTGSSFRKYKSILFLDADGMVQAPLQPLLELPLPDERSVAMPTWPSVEAPKETFYAREVAMNTLSAADADALRACCPDRLLVGITAWFLIKPDRLPSPAAMRSQVDSALERWRAAFRFNDQGLWNVLFYNVSAFYPLCLSGPMPGMSDSFHPLLVDGWPPAADGLAGLGAAIHSACGETTAKRRNMYQHPLKDCVPDEEWERKKRANRELSFK